MADESQKISNDSIGLRETCPQWMEPVTMTSVDLPTLPQLGSVRAVSPAGPPV